MVLWYTVHTIYSYENLRDNGPYVANIAVKLLFLELCGHIHFDQNQIPLLYFQHIFSLGLYISGEQCLHFSPGVRNEALYEHALHGNFKTKGAGRLVKITIYI